MKKMGKEIEKFMSVAIVGSQISNLVENMLAAVSRWPLCKGKIYKKYSDCHLKWSL